MDCLKQLTCKVPAAAAAAGSPPPDHQSPGRKQLLTRRFSDPSSDNMVSCDWQRAGHNAHL